MICIYFLITKYEKFSILIDLFEIMCKPTTDIKYENLIKWVFVKVFESQDVLRKLLHTEFWIVLIAYYY